MILLVQFCFWGYKLLEINKYMVTPPSGPVSDLHFRN